MKILFRNIFAVILAAVFLSGCGSGGGSSSSSGSDTGTGSIAFSVEWQQSSLSKSVSYLATSSDVCVDYGIATVNGYVLDSSNYQIASQGWQCSAHSGTISNVSAGSGYTVRLEGLNSSGTVTWRGEVSGVSVSSGQTASAGTITMSYVGSDTTAPTVSSTSPANNATGVAINTAITATFSESMASSTINTDTFTLFDNGTNSYVSGTVTYDSSSKTATFTPSSNLSYSTSYSAEVLQGPSGVQDMAGWLLQGTSKWSFTTEASPTSAPSAPTGVSATAGDLQVQISWSNVSGATSYNIYWSNTTGVTKTTGTKITGATSPYTHTGLTNGTTYYYVVTAVNGYGESGESGQVSATLQAWTTKASMPTARTTNVVAVNGVIYAVGGYYGSYPPTYVSTVEAYDTATNTWSTKASMPTGRALGAGNAVVGSVIYAIGGANSTGFLSTVEAYDTATNTWTTKASMPTARGTSTATVNGVIYAIGGYISSSTAVSTVEAYTP